MAWEMREIRSRKRHRRTAFWQDDARRMERTIRASAVAFSRWARQHGLAIDAAAERAGISARTLRDWESGWRVDKLKIKPRGRAYETSDRETREMMIAVFQIYGPGVSVPALQEIFPDAARRELEDLQERVQRIYTKRHVLYVLRWLKPGTVWAMDFAEAPSPIDGKFRYMLIVRDLATGKQLMALPVEAMTAQVVRDALTLAFVENAEPYVIKSDNGSAFVASETREFLASRKIVQLLSPPGLPSYNGSCEAGVGSVKTRAHHESARHDRPGAWTCDDVEAARLQANQTALPFGARLGTPDALWAARLPLVDSERDALAASIAKLAPEERVRQGYLDLVPLSQAQQDAVNRVAIGRALVAHGLLEFRRRRVSPQIKPVTTAKIS